MKRQIFLFLSIILGIMLTYSQTGIWSGNIEVRGTKLPLVFHLDEESPTLDSPAQGAKGIPVKIKKVGSDSIVLKILSIGASFKGRYNSEKMVGTFTQGTAKLPLVLTPGEKFSQRPQTPRSPFPYTQEEVCFANGEAVLKGTLTLPEGYTHNTPVIIMVTGSGLQNRDEEIFDHKPFAVIADALARGGIASLRYDDRGFGESTGDPVNCTTEDLMQDALSGINLLRERFNRVGVLGHSEGGTIAFMLGADNKVDFIVSLAGMIVSGEETLLEQNSFMLAQAGYPQSVLDEYCGLLARAFAGDESINQKIESSTLPAELKQNLLPALGQLKSPYMQYFLTLDMRPRLGRVTCPVLALNGIKDTQVFYEKNLNALKSGLPSNKSNRILAMDGLNHLFQHCTTGIITEYGTIEETVSPEVLDIISQWIKTINPQ